MRIESRNRPVRGLVHALSKFWGWIIGAAFLALVTLASAFFALAAIAVAAVLSLAVALVWFIMRLRRSRRTAKPGEPEVLVARKGPHGWTVEAV